MMQDEVDEEHGEIIRNEIDAFSEMFITWVNTFQKMNILTTGDCTFNNHQL